MVEELLKALYCVTFCCKSFLLLFIKFKALKYRVVYPERFKPDPDTDPYYAFQVIPDQNPALKQHDLPVHF
jgi:hypothetical protein